MITVIQRKNRFNRSSPSEVFSEKYALKICSKLAGKHTCRNVISIKLQSNFIEITLRHGCSPVNLLSIFRTPYNNTSEGSASELSCSNYFRSLGVVVFTPVTVLNKSLFLKYLTFAFPIDKYHLNFWRHLNINEKCNDGNFAE